MAKAYIELAVLCGRTDNCEIVYSLPGGLVCALFRFEFRGLFLLIWRNILFCYLINNWMKMDSGFSQVHYSEVKDIRLSGATLAS